MRKHALSQTSGMAQPAHHQVRRFSRIGDGLGKCHVPARTRLQPEMPYTLGLLASIPRMDVEVGGRLLPIPGNPPSPIHLPTGCVFEPRCRYSAMTNGLSETVRPDLLPSGDEDHLVRCHLPPETRQRIASEVLSALESGANQ